MGEPLVEVREHGVTLVAEDLAVGSRCLLPVHGCTSDTGEVLLELASIGHNSVGQGGDARVVLLLGLGEGCSSGSLGVREALLEASKLGSLVGGLLGESNIELLGGSSQVLGELELVGSSLGTADSELRGGLLAHGSDLLVLVEQSTKEATGTLGLGVTLVSDLDNALEGGLSVTVDLGLGGPVGLDHGSNSLALTDETVLLLLDLGGELHESSLEVLLGIGNLLGGLGASSLDVLHRLAEVGAGQSSQGSQLVVGVDHLGLEAAIEVGTILGHLDLDLAEHVLGVLAGLLDALHDSLDGVGVTLGGGSTHSRELVDSSLAGSIELAVDDVGVGLDLSIDGTSILLHLLGLSGDILVQLGDLGVGLGLEGKQGTLLGTDGLTELTHDVLPVAALLGTEGVAALEGHLLLVGKTLVEGGHLAFSPLHLLGKVGLGDSSSRLDGSQDLSPDELAGLLGVGAEVTDLLVEALGEEGDLEGDLSVHGITSLLVDSLHLLLHGESTTLALGDGITHGTLELVLVVLGDGSKLGTASDVENIVLLDDASQLVHLAVDLGLKALDSLVHLGELGTEGILGAAESGSGVHLRTAGGHGQSLVGLGLGLGVLLEHIVQGAGGLAELALRVLAVLGHLPVDGTKTSIEGLHETAELLVLLEVLGIPVGTELDHALEFGIDDT